MDDGLLAAARYLCASGADLTTLRGWTHGAWSYNHCDVYVTQVLAAANSYAARTSQVR